MRSPIIVLLLVACACQAAPTQSSKTSNEALPVGGAGQPVANISVTREGDGCTARWNGEALSPEALLHRGTEALRPRLSRISGPVDVNSLDFPHVRLEAPGDTAWACLEPTISAIEHAGFGSVLLRPLGNGSRTEQQGAFQFAVNGRRFATAIVEVEGRGRLRLNGRSVGLRQLPDAIAEAGVRDELAGMFGESVVPRPGATLADVYDAIWMLHAAEGRPFLADCRDAVPAQGVSLRC